MSDRTWDEESAAFRPPGSGKLAALGRWFSRLAFIALVTLGLGYYWPLHRAHRRLTVEHRETVAALRHVRAELAKASSDLMASQAAVVAMKASDEAARAKLADTRAAGDAALSGATTALHRSIDKNWVSLSLRDGGLVASIPLAQVTGTDALPAAALARRLGLCDITRALLPSGEHRSLSVTAFAEPGVAKLRSGTRWDVASRRVTRTLEALGSSCGLPVGAASAIVRDATPGTDAGGLELAVVEAALTVREEPGSLRSGR